MLKRAELQSVDTIPAAFERLPLEVSTHWPSLALRSPVFGPVAWLSRARGSIHATSGAMAVPKGKLSGLAYISEFTEEAKASGLVQKAIDHAACAGFR